MKSIMISVRPEQVVKILNGKITVEIRKTAPKEWVDYLGGRSDKKPEPMTGYIYCTKDGYLHLENEGYWSYSRNQKYTYKRNGKVVAKFMLDEIYKYQIEDKHTWEDPHFEETTQKLMGIGLDELHNYVGNKTFYGWHISDLVIFDKPKELDQFEYLNPSGTRNVGQRSLNGLPSKKHPPQSWCYVEEKE